MEIHVPLSLDAGHSFEDFKLEVFSTAAAFRTKAWADHASERPLRWFISEIASHINVVITGAQGHIYC